MKVIAYSNPDGSMAVVYPRAQADVVLDLRRTGNPAMADTIEAMTYDQFIDWVKAKDVPTTATATQIMDALDIPTDRATRAAWRLS